MASAKTGCALLVSVLLLAGCRERHASQIASQASQPKAAEEPIHRPEKPRSDYVGSQVCANCHQEIAGLYASHPMGQSLGEVDRVEVVENYGHSTEFSPPGNRKYKVERTEQGVFHHEVMEGVDGAILYDQSVPVQFAVGSGIRGRSYLTNHDGLLFMSSIGWYTEGQRWDLSPGYRPQSHQRFDRQVSDGCLACHAGRMNTIEGQSDRFDSKRPFFEQSIGCERCHGPGASHVARYEKADLTLRDDIVDPAKLEPIKQDAVCNQCHLQGSRRITRYGRTEFDFRPGNCLTDIWMVNVGSEKQSVEGDFPAVTQAQQMHESTCYQKSRQMVCTSCHDPHRSIPAKERSDYYSERCGQCHGQGSPNCSVSAAEQVSKSCIDCHMPRLAATDVPHTSQTDHRIPRNAKIKPVAKPREEIVLFDERSNKIPAWEADRAQGILFAELAKRRTNRQQSLQSLALLKPLADRLPDDLALWQAMGAAYLQVEKNAEAAKCWEKVLEIAPKNAQALESLTLYYQHKGDLQQAKQFSERLISVNPWRAEFYGRYAHVLGQLGETDAGIKAAERCLELNPTLTHVHLWLAEVYQQTGQTELSERHQALYQQFEHKP